MLETTSSQPKRFHFVQAMVGGGLAALGTLGLGLTRWRGGSDPSTWFVVTGNGLGREISGWTITAAFGSALVVGLILLVLARPQRRSRS